MKWELKNIDKLTNDNWTNLYRAHYECENKSIDWAFASRNKKEDLVCINSKNLTSCNSVCIAPRYFKDGEEYIILCKEFRFPLNNYIYSFPAGLVEKGEDIVESAIRELREEIGAEVSSIRPLTNICYNSEGLTDENVVMFEAIVSSLHNQQLEETEDINVEIVNVKDLEAFVKDKIFSAKTNLYCTMIYQMHKLKISNAENYKFVKDIDAYVSVGLETKELDEFWVKKISPVYAVQGVENQIVTTYTINGTRETTNVVKRDKKSNQCDYVVTNSFGETYVVDYNTFNLKYVKTNSPNVYEPISNPIRCVRVTENIEFQSHTGQLFKVKKDDYLIIPYNRYIYGITKEALYQDYTFIKD